MRDRMELSDFDKCEICINIIVLSHTANKTTKLYIIKNRPLNLGFFITIQKYK